MNAYVWRYVAGATSSYHSGAGILAVASDLHAARDAIRSVTRDKDWDDEPSECEALTKDPDRVFAVFDVEPFVMVFPDAGCC